MSARRVAVVLSVFILALTAVPVAAPYSTGYSVDPAAAEDDPGAAVFLNEIHYANTGVDAGEFVEVAGPPGTDLTGVEVVLYDGETARRTTGRSSPTPSASTVWWSWTTRSRGSRTARMLSHW